MTQPKSRRVPKYAAILLFCPIQIHGRSRVSCYLGSKGTAQLSLWLHTGPSAADACERWTRVFLLIYFTMNINQAIVAGGRGWSRECLAVPPGLVIPTGRCRIN